MKGPGYVPIKLFIKISDSLGFPSGAVIENPPANAGDMDLIPGLGRFHGEGNGNTPVFLLGKFHGQRSLVGYSPRGHKESDTTERLHFHFQWLSKHTWGEVKSLNCVRLFATPWMQTMSLPRTLPGSSIHGILQARILEWVTISFSRGSSRPRDQTRVSHIGGRRFNLWASREAQVTTNPGGRCCYSQPPFHWWGNQHRKKLSNLAKDIQLETLTPEVMLPTFPDLLPTSQLHEASHYPCLTRCWSGEARRGPDRCGHAHDKVPSPRESEGNHRHLKGWLSLLTVTVSSPAASLFSTWELAVYMPTSPSRLEMCCSRNPILVTFLSSSCCPSYKAQNWHIWNV